MPRKTFKDEANLSRVFSTRISERMWFGLLLVSRRRREPMSVVSQRLFKCVLEGRADAIADFHVSGLDEMFDPRPWKRLQNLHALYPELVTFPEQEAITTLQGLGDEVSAEQWHDAARYWGLAMDVWR